MPKIFVLIEQAIGLALFRIKGAKSLEDLDVLLKTKKFEDAKSSFKVVEFMNFDCMETATENATLIGNGIVSKEMMKFLKKHFTDVEDSELILRDKHLVENLQSKNKLSSNLKIKYSSDVSINLNEITRNFSEFSSHSREINHNAHLGLSVNFSKRKTKLNDNQSDYMIIQTISLLDHTEKVLNKLASRLREWFGYHYPEMYKIVPDNKIYAQVVELIKCRSGATEEVTEQLDKITGDSAKTQKIIECAKISMGVDLTVKDFETISDIATKIINMFKVKDNTTDYLGRKMSEVCPNLSNLVGNVVTARLIAHAGSLKNLAKCAASTIQILGAEKALFRAMKTRGNTPKYGLLFHSSFVGRADKNDKGRISRFLAAKITIACQLDCFSDNAIGIYGKHLKEQVEDQLTFLETGKETKHTEEVMEAACDEAEEYIDKLANEINNKVVSTEKKNKRKSDLEGKEAEMKKPKIECEVKEEKVTEKKKKKITDIVKQKITVKEEESVNTNVEKKKKKKSLTIEEINCVKVEIKEEAKEPEVPSSEKKKKKKSITVEAMEVDDSTQKEHAKKKKKKSKVIEETELVESKKDKKKKSKQL